MPVRLGKDNNPEIMHHNSPDISITINLEVGKIKIIEAKHVIQLVSSVNFTLKVTNFTSSSYYPFQ